MQDDTDVIADDVMKRIVKEQETELSEEQAVFADVGTSFFALVPYEA